MARQTYVAHVDPNNQGHLDKLEEFLVGQMDDTLSYYALDIYAADSDNYNAVTSQEALDERLRDIQSNYKGKYTDEYINNNGSHTLGGNTQQEMAKNTVEYIKSGFCFYLALFNSKSEIIIGILEDGVLNDDSDGMMEDYTNNVEPHTRII